MVEAVAVVVVSVPEWRVETERGGFVFVSFCSTLSVWPCGCGLAALVERVWQIEAVHGGW